MTEMDYTNFKAPDFIMDESFQQHCLGINEEANNFWMNWIKENQSQQTEIDKAKNLYKILNGNNTFPDFKRQEAAFNSLLKSRGIVDTNSMSSQANISPLLNERLHENELDENIKDKGFLRRLNGFWKVAAILILIIGITTIIYQYNNKNEPLLFATGYGIIDTLTLPDNSFVILNSNSKVRYNKNRNTNKPRELWLEGEAFFNIKRIYDSLPNERFIVHVKNANIEVLGTQFNVKERRDKTEIVLQQGKIKVTFTSGTEPDIILQPGQIVTIGDHKQTVISNTTAPEEYTAWKNKKLILTNATLKEIVEYLEDNFGKRIVLTDAVLANRRIEGTFKLDNLDDAMLFLSKALNLNIIHQDSTLFISSK
jgi:ferric-dicitrate binding protein FerR (iron transport regulator)